MNATDSDVQAAATWWQAENENHPSDQSARLAAIFTGLAAATPTERADCFEHAKTFETEMAKAVLQGIAADAPRVDPA